MIYFMQSSDGGPVKIGYSDNVELRRRQLERRYGVSLVVLATLEGGSEEEAEIHAHFDHLRFDGIGRRGRRPEQFRPASDLMDFIGSPLLVGANPDTVEMMGGLKVSDSNLVSVKIDRTVVGKAKLVATHFGVSVAELLSDLVSGPLDKKYIIMLRELEEKNRK